MTMAWWRAMRRTRIASTTRQNRRQALWHGRHGQRHTQQQYRDHIGHVINVRQEQDRGHHDGSHAQGSDAQHLAQMRDLDLQWRRRVGWCPAASQCRPLRSACPWQSPQRVRCLAPPPPPPPHPAGRPRGLATAPTHGAARTPVVRRAVRSGRPRATGWQPPRRPGPVPGWCRTQRPDRPDPPATGRPATRHAARRQVLQTALHARRWRNLRARIALGADERKHAIRPWRGRG